MGLHTLLVLTTIAYACEICMNHLSIAQISLYNPSISLSPYVYFGPNMPPTFGVLEMPYELSVQVSPCWTSVCNSLVAACSISHSMK